MVFVSERIVNISELENLIRKADLEVFELSRQLEETGEKEEFLSKLAEVRNILESAVRFEFRLEQRVTEVSEHPRLQENPSREGN